MNEKKIDVFDKKETLNNDLLGVIEWIVNQQGTVKVFNEFIVLGVVKGFKYRYFFSEGWIALFTKDCPKGKAKSYETLEGFINAVKTEEPI